MRNKQICGGLIIGLALASAACGRAHSTRQTGSFTVVGNSKAVNAFIADALPDQRTDQLTVTPRGDRVQATFAMADGHAEAVKRLTRQALARGLSYSVHFETVTG